MPGMPVARSCARLFLLVEFREFGTRLEFGLFFRSGRATLQDFTQTPTNALALNSKPLYRL